MESVQFKDLSIHERMYMDGCSLCNHIFDINDNVYSRVSSFNGYYVHSYICETCALLDKLKKSK